MKQFIVVMTLSGLKLGLKVSLINVATSLAYEFYFKGGNIELARGYGFANVEDQEPFTAESRFAIASVSKSFTTTLSAKLLATRPMLVCSFVFF